jgi:hypothetical protein
VAYDGDMQSDFDDLRFTQADGTTLIDAWLEEKTDSTSAIVWVEFPTTPANTVTEDYYMYYGNAGGNVWNGTNTFLQYHGATTTTFMDSAIVSPTNVAYEGKIKRIGVSNILWGLSNHATLGDDDLLIQSYTGGNDRRIMCANEGTRSTKIESPALPSNIWVKALITNDGTTVYGYIDSNEINTGGLTTNLPNENLGLYFWEVSGSGEQEYSFARKYVINPATYGFGGEESAPSTGNPYWYYNLLKRRN